ncbi:hemolysin family protein [Holophaga foetida]|uniref:hemolysin family protein n=1 Tax=Holophaga foetida TaxID=35839 RepID=UPI00024725DD|nr:hemolysin family protein [Holophaga foetida]
MDLFTLIATLLLILATAFFVLAEFSAVRVRSTQLEALLPDEPRAAQALDVHQHLDLHLSSIQVAITLLTITLGAVGEGVFIEGFRTLFHRLPWPHLGVLLGSVLGLLVITLLQVVLAELLPRSFALRATTVWALRTARPLLYWSRLIRPVTWVLVHLTRFTERLMGVAPEEVHAEEHAPTEEEFRHMLIKSQAQGSLELSRKELIENVFNFSKRSIKEVAIPRAQVVFFDLHRPQSENLHLARLSPHTRIPLVDGDLDHVVGVIHLKELLWALNDQGDRMDLRSLARPAFFVPEMRLIQDLLLDFQKEKQHLALVVNEHGGIDGIVTLEDVLEELVGEIQDEFDREVINLKQTRGGAWVAQGNVTLEQLEDHLDLKIEVEAGSVSLGGYFQEELGRILKVGDELKIQDWRVRVLEMRGMAPRKFLLRPPDSALHTEDPSEEGD